MSGAPKVDSLIREKIMTVPQGKHLYTILDGASVPRLPQTMAESEVTSVCLLSGELDSDLALAAPYLVALDVAKNFTAWLIDQGWGQHWGVFVVSAADFRIMRQHMRSLLFVYSPDDVPLFFRFYDPRVLRVFLPTCAREELAHLFGPVDLYLMESSDGRSLLQCELIDGELSCRQSAC